MASVFELYKKGACADFVTEETAFSGVLKVARKVCGDVELVTGRRPFVHVLPEQSFMEGIGNLSRTANTQYFVVAATAGRSRFLEELDQSGKLRLSAVRGKRECFSFQIVETRGENPVTLLVIAGSDKRGTIYGLFHISELMGVSPWVTFTNVLPEKKKEVCFTDGDCLVSKEPSVKYRGFFINDEWPAFGNWTFEHFGGFTAKMYDILFETLLRLKGNYLWPAMWSSSFTLDGPGEANAILADEYGIVMSNSHHEPCLRHSEEWDLVRGENSPYGNEWNYYTNREGLLRYWKDGLLRSGKYENIITIGMRGERDSSMLGPDASLKENIDLLKDIITEQRKLIAECVRDGENVPQMLALYKEVEAYFYGNEGEHDGLRDWDGLNGVTFMLCEDNFGNMRTLPTEDLRDRDGGWGMYYHFDYHGGPVSYEWVNSSYLPKVWDQMTKAYEFGIRDIWVVNVGDLMFNEYPLSFFMDLAYDYERWGVSDLNAPAKYLKQWIRREFGSWSDGVGQKLLADVMKGYTKLNHNRKPEAMRPDLYHPVHGEEAERTLGEIHKLERKLEKLRLQVPRKAEPSFWALVYYPAMGSLNVQKWNLYAGLNHFFARMGALIANDYAEKMRECLAADKYLTDTFHALLGGKWNGFGLSKHVGFVTWNDEGCKYPVRMETDPVQKRRILAYAKGDGDVITAGGAWSGKMIRMRRFMRPDISEAQLVLLGAGSQAADYEIICEKDWIRFSKRSGALRKREEITVRVDKDAMQRSMQNGGAQDKTADFIVRYAGGDIKVKIECEAAKLPECTGRTFVEYDGIVSIEAEHYAENRESMTGYFVRIPEYGRTLSGVKAFPVTHTFAAGDAPKLTYRIWANHPGNYRLLVYAAPVNPHEAGKDVTCLVTVNESESMRLSLIPENYNAGEPSCPSWCEMVLNQIRVVETQTALRQGLNTIRVEAAEPGFILEKIVMVREGQNLPETYLGPEETYYIN